MSDALLRELEGSETQGEGRVKTEAEIPVMLQQAKEP